MARLCEFPGLAPQAGFGAAAPTFPHREAIQKRSSQGAKRALTVSFLKPGLALNTKSRPPLLSVSRTPGEGGHAPLRCVTVRR